MPRKTFIINVPIADLRKKPISAVKSVYKDPLQESQLLFGEGIRYIREEGEWAYIEALEQLKYSNERGWIGYPGWVLKSEIVESKIFKDDHRLTVAKPWVNLYHEPDLCAPTLLSVQMGTRLEFIEEEADWFIVRLPDERKAAIQRSSVVALNGPISLQERVRSTILERGYCLLGQPYYWGGRSFYRADWPHKGTSCDCSGLVNLLYRVEGIDIPRDAHDQFLICEKREFHQLQPADLIFLADKEKPGRMEHVMLYAGGDHLLDTNMADSKVVTVTAKQRLGVSFSQLKWGDEVGKSRIYFGTPVSPPVPVPGL